MGGGKRRRGRGDGGKGRHRLMQMLGNLSKYTSWGRRERTGEEREGRKGEEGGEGGKEGREGAKGYTIHLWLDFAGRTRVRKISSSVTEVRLIS